MQQLKAHHLLPGALLSVPYEHLAVPLEQAAVEQLLGRTCPRPVPLLWTEAHKPSPAVRPSAVLGEALQVQLAH